MTADRLKRAIGVLPMDYVVKEVDNRKKIPRNKIFLHFFAGKIYFKNTMFLSYPTVNNHNQA